jgi:hypothetical protein
MAPTGTGFNIVLASEISWHAHGVHDGRSG